MAGVAACGVRLKGSAEGDLRRASCGAMKPVAHFAMFWQLARPSPPWRSVVTAINDWYD